MRIRSKVKTVMEGIFTLDTILVLQTEKMGIFFSSGMYKPIFKFK